ncbi:MAG: hypothetical protein NZO16_07335, partial [Deltaproteobacteria bacterium]|nr:hypothetical protein [Deltaproteobacteria bacterium]
FAVVAVLPFSTWYFFSRHVNSQDASLSARQVVRKFMGPILSRFVENIVTKVRDPELAYSLFKTVNSVCASLGTYLPTGATMATIGFFGYMEFAKVGIWFPPPMDVVQVGFNKLWGQELLIAIVASISCFLFKKFREAFNDTCYYDVFLRDQK